MVSVLVKLQDAWFFLNHFLNLPLHLPLQLNLLHLHRLLTLHLLLNRHIHTLLSLLLHFHLILPLTFHLSSLYLSPLLLNLLPNLYLPPPIPRNNIFMAVSGLSDLGDRAFISGFAVTVDFATIMIFFSRRKLLMKLIHVDSPTLRR